MTRVWYAPQVWISGIDSYYSEQERLYSDDIDLPTKYWNMFYNAVLLLSGNEMGPRTNFEIGFLLIFYLLDLIISGNIFGNVAYLVLMSNRI